MLKKSKPACTASSPSVALFHRNPIRFFPLFDPARHAKTTGKGRAAGDSRVLTGRCAKGMTELAVGTRPRGVRISRERGRGEERRGQGQEEWVSIKRGASEPLTGVGWFGGALEGEGTAGADHRNEKFEDASSINLRRCGWPAPFSHPLHLGHVLLNKTRSC